MHVYRLTSSQWTVDCNVQLAATCLLMHNFFWRAILTRKVGHTGIVFGVQSGFISRSVHARLQISACSGYYLLHPGYYPDTH